MRRLVGGALEPDRMRDRPLACTARTKAWSGAVLFERYTSPDGRTNEKQGVVVRVPERWAQPVKHLRQA